MNAILHVSIGVLPEGAPDIGDVTHSLWLEYVNPRDAAEAARAIRECEAAEERAGGSGDVMNVFAGVLEGFAKAGIPPH